MITKALCKKQCILVNRLQVTKKTKKALSTDYFCGRDRKCFDEGSVAVFGLLFANWLVLNNGGEQKYWRPGNTE